MLVQVRAVEVGQPVPVLREVRRHPVDDDADALLVAAVDEVLEVIGRAVAGGDRVVADGLVAPGAVERMLGQGQDLDVGEAEVLHVRQQRVGQLAVAQPAVALLRHPPPRAEVHLVHADGLLEPVRLPALVHPRLVVPLVLVVVPHHRRGARAQLGCERIGVRLLGQEVVLPLDLELVEVALLHRRHEQLPQPGAAPVLHRMVPPVPPVEVADHADPYRVGRPHREVHTLHSVHGDGMRAHLLERAVVGALAEQVLVEVGDLEREAVGVVQLPHVAVEPGHAQAVLGPAALPQHQFEQAVLVRPLHAVRRAGSHHLHARRERLERADDGPRLVRMLAQHVERLTVQSVHNGFDGTIRQRGLHALKPRNILSLQDMSNRNPIRP
jgi:hypothetical protein